MAKAKYEVVSLTIEELLSPLTAEFEVPDFQRAYSWEAEQINQLFDDVFVSSVGDELPYFLGSIVLASDEDGNSERAQILDGQQRLTTISLLIAVLRQKLEESGALEEALQYKMRLFSYNYAMEPKPKILLQRGEDSTVYEALITDPSKHRERRYVNTRIGEGLTQIYEATQKYVASELSAQPHRTAVDVYRMMLAHMLRNVEIVRITSPSEKDAFRLFETLNDRGLALSAADLIKNKLFSRAAKSERDLEDAKYYWGKMVELTRDDNVVNFLRYYWIASSSFVRKQNLYDRYRNYVSNLSQAEASELALRLYYAAEDYQQIINPKANEKGTDLSVIDALERLTIYRARSCRPALLACGNSMYQHRESERQAIVDLCESITIRYSVVGQQNPNRLEVIYSELCEALRKPHYTLKEILTSEPLSNRMLEIPSDSDFRYRLQHMEILSVTPAWRQVLARLNSDIGTGETRPEGPDKVHVDHILPQNPSPTVIIESRFASKEEASRFIHRIGNLTLLSSRMNQKESNKPFSQKKESYASSEFAMTKQLADHDKWGQSEIEERSKEFAERAVEVFPHPLNIVTKGN